MNPHITFMLCKLSVFLDIKTPEYVYCEPKNDSELLCELDISNYRLIFRSDEALRVLIYQMAHAMRRIYQHRYNSKLTLGYRYRNEVDAETFANQPAEIDAHAYAACFCKYSFADEVNPFEFSTYTQFLIKMRMHYLYQVHEYLTLGVEHVLKSGITAQDFAREQLEYMKTHRRRLKQVYDGSEWYSFRYPQSPMVEAYKKCLENNAKNPEKLQDLKNIKTPKDVINSVAELHKLMDEIMAIDEKPPRNKEYEPNGLVYIPHPWNRF